MICRLLILTAVVSLSWTSQAFSQDAPIFEGPQEELDAIFAVFAEWGRARDAGDVEAVVAVHHPDMLIMNRNRAILVGHDGVRTFYAENYSEKSDRKLYSDMSELRVFGDVATAIGRFLVSDEENGIEDPGYYLILLRKNADGAWKIYRDIDTPSPDGLELKPPGPTGSEEK
jgi:uncharacterized protein (TIGR02246 family)